jgi:hypothetical protein
MTKKTMKLYAADNSDLMEISSIYPEDDNLVIEGTIMGAMPIRAIVKPSEVRRAMGLMDMKTKVHAGTMLFKTSR